MAYAEITDTSAANFVLWVRELQYATAKYDNFIVQFLQNSSVVLTSTITLQYPSETSHEWGIDYGRWVVPKTTYTVKVSATYKGIQYLIDTITVTTDAISPPSGIITPQVYPTIKAQNGYGNCVAQAITTAMELFHSQAMGYSSSYENYSVSFFYGTDAGSTETMSASNALSSAMTIGAPRWELCETQFPQNTYKATAQYLYQNACNIAKNNAIQQCISGYDSIDFYDCSSVKNAIQNNGCCLLFFREPNNIYSIPSSGIVPQPANGYANSNHELLLIGLTNINGKAYWIAQNSWGTSWGNGGRCYIPYDWGCGVQGSRDSSNTNSWIGWVLGCYAIYDNYVPTAHPSPPTITLAQKSSGGATITFTTSSSSDQVLIYARKQGTTNWYPKSANGGTSYGVPSISPVTITLDDSGGTYEVSALAVRNNMVSLRSTIVVVGAGKVGATAYIYTGSSWQQATPYIFNGSTWVEASPYIYSGGWKPT